MKLESSTSVPINHKTKSAVKTLLDQGWPDNKPSSVLNARRVLMENFRSVAHSDNEELYAELHPFLKHLDYIFSINTELEEGVNGYDGMGTAHEFLFENIMSVLATCDEVTDRTRARAVSAVKRMLSLSPQFKDLDLNEISCELGDQLATLRLAEPHSFSMHELDKKKSPVLQLLERLHKDESSGLLNSLSR